MSFNGSEYTLLRTFIVFIILCLHSVGLTANILSLFLLMADPEMQEQIEKSLSVGRTSFEVKLSVWFMTAVLRILWRKITEMEFFCYIPHVLWCCCFSSLCAVCHHKSWMWLQLQLLNINSIDLQAGCLDIWERAVLAIKREAYSIKCNGPRGVVVTEKFSPSTSVWLLTLSFLFDENMRFWSGWNFYLVQLEFRG